MAKNMNELKINPLMGNVKEEQELVSYVGESIESIYKLLVENRQDCRKAAHKTFGRYSVNIDILDIMSDNPSLAMFIADKETGTLLVRLRVLDGSLTFETCITDITEMQEVYGGALAFIKEFCDDCN